MPSCRWRYIPSALNPADCVSRGLFPSETVNHSLYWHGPPFVCLIESEWPTETYELIPPSGLPDYKPLDAMTCNVTSLQSPAWYHRFSSLTRMQRVTAYVQRFITRIKHLPTSVGPLQRSELEHALVPIIIATQRTYLAALVSQLNADDPKISPRSMAQLAPFIDQTGIIRVGGRLTHARSRIVAQCPILLPKVTFHNVGHTALPSYIPARRSTTNRIIISTYLLGDIGKISHQTTSVQVYSVCAS